MIVIESKNENDTLKIGVKLAEYIENKTIFFFHGDLGVGKTVLIRGIYDALRGNRQEIVSPTFVYVKEHILKTGVKFFHFDLFRKSKGDFDREIMSYVDENEPNSIFCIEWPDMISDELKAYLINKYKCVNVDIKLSGDLRLITIND